MNDIEHFRRIAGDNPFRAWLEAEKETLVKTLASADGRALYQAQGKFQLIERLLSLLEKAKDLR